MLLLSRSITYGMEKKFKSQYIEYGGSETDFRGDLELPNAVYLVDKGVVTVETIYNATADRSKITIHHLASIYDSLGRLGKKLYLDLYVLENKGTKKEDSTVQQNTSSAPAENPLTMLMNAAMMYKEPNKYEREDILQEYIKFYISMMIREHSSEMLEDVLERYSDLVRGIRTEKSDLVKSFKALSAYNDMAADERSNYKLVVGRDAGITLIEA